MPASVFVQEFETFCDGHLSGVRTRLSAACRPYDARRAVLRRQRLAKVLQGDTEPMSDFSGRKPSLWEVEGEAE